MNLVPTLGCCIAEDLTYSTYKWIAEAFEIVPVNQTVYGILMASVDSIAADALELDLSVENLPRILTCIIQEAA